MRDPIGCGNTAATDPCKPIDHLVKLQRIVTDQYLHFPSYSSKGSTAT